TSTKLGDVFSFAGTTPETINGRLAMVGFVSAIGVEVASGRDLFSKLSSGIGVSSFLLSTLLFSAASLTSTKLGDVFSFAGAAPETINGRLAMVGFVSAIGVEVASGRDLFSQLSSGTGVSWFLLSTLLFSAASLVPMLKGVTAQSKSQDIMSSSAEIWNGRFAMLGLLALAFTEY
ncbi:hypothetical protein KI387_000097, partial [Taxus chinensis]